MKRAQRFLLPALLALLVAFQVRRSSDLLDAQRLLNSVEQRTAGMLYGGDIDKAKLRAHLVALADARKLDAAEVAIPAQIGSQHLMLGELEPARRAYVAAMQLEPRPEILVNLGKVFYSQGAEMRAVRFFGQAVRLDPRLMKEVPLSLRSAVSDALRRKDDPHGPDEDGQVEP